MDTQIKRRDISALRREHILNAAATLFSSCGYHGVGVDAIARCAGISKGNLYWHFTSKKDIFHQLFEHVAQPLYEPLERILEEDTLPREKLRALARACLNTAEANPEAVRLVLQITFHPDLRDLASSEYTEWMKTFVERITPLFAAIGEPDPERIATFFAVTLDSLMGLSVTGPDIFNKEQVLAVIEERFISYRG